MCNSNTGKKNIVFSCFSNICIPYCAIFYTQRKLKTVKDAATKETGENWKRDERKKNEKNRKQNDID